MEQIRTSQNEIRLASVDQEGVICYDVPGQWKCRKCYGVFEDKKNPPVFCPLCERNSSFVSMSSPIFNEPWRPYGEPVVFSEMDLLYANIMEFIKEHLSLRNVQEQQVLALWIIASYRQQDFFTAPYLQFIGPIESGKTRALEVLEMLAFKAVNFISISPAALCRLVERYGIIVLLDQAEQKFNTKYDRGCEMYDIFMSGYKRGQQYVVASKEDETGTISRNVFGFKALSSTRSFDEALASRSLIFRMKQGVPKVKDIGRESFEAAGKLRNMLMYYHLKQEDLPLTNPQISGRRRELFMPLLRVGKYFDIAEEDLAEYLDLDRKKMADEMADTLEADVLREIKIVLHAIDENEKILVKDIAMRLDIKPKIVGWRLKNMNIPRFHSHDGAYINFTDEKTIKELNYLFARYHIGVF